MEDQSNKEFAKALKKRMYTFSLRMIRFIDALPKDRVCYRLGDQLLRSSTSIIGNYVEGQSASSRKDLIKYMVIALKSANESKLWLSLLKDSRELSRDEVDWLLNEMTEFAKILGRSIVSLKKTEIKAEP